MKQSISLGTGGLKLSVHQEISTHSAKQADRIVGYKNLDVKRELYIEEALEKCKKGQPFNVDEINKATDELNFFAKANHLPQRSYVTSEMVKEYCEKAK